MGRLSLTFLGAMGLAVTAALASPSPTSPPPTATTAQATHAPTPLSADQATLSSAAAAALHRIDEARMDIAANDETAAREQLQQADDLLETVAATLPTSPVKDRIWVARQHLEHESSRSVVPDLIPIFSSLDEISGFVPVISARTHLDKAKTHLEQGQSGAASAELREADAALVYSEIDVPLTQTRDALRSASADLAKHRTREADDALQAAQEGVIFLSVKIDSPMTKAKYALSQAMTDYAAGAYPAAHKDLNRATACLLRAVKEKDDGGDREIRRLVTDIEALSRKIDHASDQNRSDLRGLWQRAKALAQRSADYVATTWQRLRSSEPARKDIVEAKLHLSFAEIAVLTSHDTSRARGELDDARAYLNAALRESRTAYHQDIDRLLKTIAELQTRLGPDAPPAAEPLETTYGHALAQANALIARM